MTGRGNFAKNSILSERQQHELHRAPWRDARAVCASRRSKNRNLTPANYTQQEIEKTFNETHRHGNRMPAKEGLGGNCEWLGELAGSLLIRVICPLSIIGASVITSASC